MDSIQTGDQVRAIISEGEEAGLPVSGMCEMVLDGMVVVRDPEDFRYVCAESTAQLSSQPE